MGMLKETAEWMVHLSGFIVIGADFFLPWGFLEKAIIFAIGALLIYMIWLH